MSIEERAESIMLCLNNVCNTGYTLQKCDYSFIGKQIDEIKKEVTDVQPVKHGRWIDCTFYDPYEKSWEQNFEFKCSNCGHKIYHKPNDDNLFCGHCGVKMDLKDGDAK